MKRCGSRRSGGGEVVVAMAGPKDGEQQIRTALAMGADRAVLVEAGTDLDSLAVAKVLSKVVGEGEAGVGASGEAIGGRRQQPGGPDPVGGSGMAAGDICVEGGVFRGREEGAGDA